MAIAIGVIALAAAIASVMPQLHANTWIFRDGRFYVNVATTIVEDLSLDQHAFAASWYTGTLGWNADLEPGWSNVALGAHGEHWPKHPWIHPLIASPVYFALGLPGTLAWNLLMFSLIAAGLYRFARAYAEPAYAATAVAVFVLATAILQSAYDFSVDVLMLAIFAQGLAAVLAGRGVLAGVCIALCVVIKPTALMLMPALLLTIGERRDRTTLFRSLGAGTAVLLAYAAINWWMYGKPWWSGYNRTLVTVGGEPVVADHLDAFSTPFAEGFVRMWGGYYGLAHTFTAVVLAVPGVLLLLRRRPLHAIGVLLGVAASLVVFAKYEYEGHRFHWPALALTVPSIALTLELAARGLRALRARIPVASDAPRAAGRAASIAVVAACAITLLTGPTLEQRVLAAGAWGAGALDLSLALGLDGAGAALAVIALHLAIAGLLASRVARLLERVVPIPIAALGVASCALLPEVREACIGGGPIALACAALAYAAERARAAAALADAHDAAGASPAHVQDAVVGAPAHAREAVGGPPADPRDASVASLPSAPRDARAPLLRWLSASAGLAVALGALLAARGADDETVALLPYLARSLDEPSPVRLLLPWLALAIPGLAIAARRDARTAAALGALAIAVLVPGVAVRGTSWLPITTVLLAAPAAIAAEALASALARATRHWDARRAAIAIAAAVAILLAIGGVRRAVAAAEPFRVASYEGARHALVFHDRVPCDFLAWEHMSWECSHFDAGLYGMVGLAVSDPIRVGGEPRGLMVVPTGRSGQERRVVWPDVRAGRTLALRWAVPDGARGDAVLVVRVDDREVAAIEIPARGDATVHEQTIDTPDAGPTARLELALRPAAGRRHQATVALDAIWR